MKFLMFLFLALIEYIIITILTKKITNLKEYITINYDVFNFSPIGERKCGLNILIRIIVPTIYMVVCSGIFYKLNMNNMVSNIYLIAIIYFLIRWVTIIFIYCRKDLNDWKSETIIFIISAFINVFIYYFFITKTEDIFISVEELKNAVWISIITFVFLIIRDYIYKYIKVDERNSEKRKAKYISKKYKYLKDKYNYIIKAEDQYLKNITYAIMIYENYNRPLAIRIIEYIKFLCVGEATLGIMQVKTSKIITSEESVIDGYNKIREKYIEYKEKYKREDKVLERIVLDYNYSLEYYKEIQYIISIIYETCYYE